MDVKKLGQDPARWWLAGQRPEGSDYRTGKRVPRLGYAFVHSAVDAHTRLAYSEIHDDERGTTAAAFWRRARAFFADLRHQRRAGDHRQRRLLPVGRLVVPSPSRHRHTRTRPYRPQTNGKVERFNRTLLDEWAYARPYAQRRPGDAPLTRWLHRYNHHRHHTAIGGPPISRVNNLLGHNS